MENWKYEHYISQLQKTTRKVHENFVVSSLFHDERLRDLLPLTQHYLRRDNTRYALIDLYYPQLRVAIEIDESHHENAIEEDKRRQADVEKRNRCEFQRIRILSRNVLAEIEDLKKHLINKKNQDLKFEPWQQAQSTTIEALKAELNATLFVKIRGRIPEEDLLKRQTGTWRLRNQKRKLVQQVVVVHDRVVTRAFRDIEWWKDSTRGNKWAFKGSEIENLRAIGSLISDWNYQATTVYSHDIENH
ncbi:MAG: AbaSI family restriction endonuclease [Spirulinaceae cyanobacterium]